ncbi:hypothetical protein J6590_000688 [Homalodisca vitripennis]|nr:hypothetical protein J6590_000688 [Homalodisca vitripennis]
MPLYKFRLEVIDKLLPDVPELPRLLKCCSVPHVPSRITEKVAYGKREKATSHLRLEPDWPTIIQICDHIRQGDVQPKHALTSIKKKLNNPNPHVAMFALIVLESCVKNCGSLIHDEIGTKAYMEQLRELIKTCPHDNVKNKLLELIQAWAFAFRNSPKYRAVQVILRLLINLKTSLGAKYPTSASFRNALYRCLT